MPSVVMQSVLFIVKLNVIILSVVAPIKVYCAKASATSGLYYKSFTIVNYASV